MYACVYIRIILKLSNLHVAGYVCAVYVHMCVSVDVCIFVCVCVHVCGLVKINICTIIFL